MYASTMIKNTLIECYSVGLGRSYFSLCHRPLFPQVKPPLFNPGTDKQLPSYWSPGPLADFVTHKTCLKHSMHVIVFNHNKPHSHIHTVVFRQEMRFHSILQQAHNVAGPLGLTFSCSNLGQDARCLAPLHVRLCVCVCVSKG